MMEAMIDIGRVASTATVGGLVGAGMALSRLHRDPDGWAQIALALVVFAIIGAAASLIVQAAQAWRQGARLRRSSRAVHSSDPG
jgi:phosphate/sulfate permease